MQEDATELLKVPEFPSSQAREPSPDPGTVDLKLWQSPMVLLSGEETWWLWGLRNISRTQPLSLRLKGQRFCKAYFIPRMHECPACRGLGQVLGVPVLYSVLVTEQVVSACGL